MAAIEEERGLKSMSPFRSLLAIAALACTPALQSGEPTAISAASSSARQMTLAAQQLLAGLSPAQREKVRASLNDDVARTNWSNLPSMFVGRGGVRLGDLTDEQRKLVHALLRASTSSQGYQKIAGIIRLDDLLSEEARALAARGASPIPKEMQKQLFDSWSTENYWIRVYGDPGKDANWGWLVSGHHLAANFTVAGNRVGFTPLFLGAEPDVVAVGRYAGWRPLSHEGERGFDLVQAFDSSQRSRAVLSGDIPTDVLCRSGAQGFAGAVRGTEGQRHERGTADPAVAADRGVRSGLRPRCGGSAAGEDPRRWSRKTLFRMDGARG